MTDQVYSYPYSNRRIDFTKKETIDLDAFRKAIRDTINTRVGADLVHEVLIDQVNFPVQGRNPRQRHSPSPRRTPDGNGTDQDIEGTLTTP
ncbi:hypothetical protein GCM10010869_37590 [Mesorhizobium tianshanense]|uniref:Uncharacterized protein n=1 Tax=Mesorhizobium tianshanense TaxID=39844 RepID=A0A562P399_9HYPH|nr:hypothetical protein IQ26_02225 [Mesorhizobium tianshanense]GLS38165.1 hypothetical protein GCM10010869_37590 [Mesorhizobium tianshanense]